MSTTATAMKAATVLTDLDPTGIATNILNLAVAIHEQYGQMGANKEACKDLYKQVMLISGIVHELMKQNQIKTDAYQKVLNELKECLTECQTLIQSILNQKTKKAFIATGSDKESIDKLTTRLKNLMDTSDFALTTETYACIEKNTGSDSDIRMIVEAIAATVQVSSSMTHTQLNTLQHSHTVTHAKIENIGEKLNDVQRQLQQGPQSRPQIKMQAIEEGGVVSGHLSAEQTGVQHANAELARDGDVQSDARLMRFMQQANQQVDEAAQAHDISMIGIPKAAHVGSANVTQTGLKAGAVRYEAAVATAVSIAEVAQATAEEQKQQKKPTAP